MVQRWKPSWVQGRMIPAGVHPIDGYVSAADHARIVAEAGAAVFAFHPEWTVTGMCDPDCLACRRLTELITERSAGYEEGKADAEQEHAAAWDRATFDSTAYEQGKRDAAEEARAAERRHWEARFRNAEQAHAAALAAVERLPGHTAQAYIETSDWSGGQSAQVRFQQSEQGRWVDKGDVLTLLGNAAAAPRILTRDGWWPFGSFVDYDFPLEFDGEGEDGLPIWERPDKSRMQPRTLTAADPGYHSQRCLHCDHIRATHTLTAHGCIGHALPGRPGADCPCAEFIHDGEATP